MSTIFSVSWDEETLSVAAILAPPSTVSMVSLFSVTLNSSSTSEVATVLLFLQLPVLSLPTAALSAFLLSGFNLFDWPSSVSLQHVNGGTTF